MRKIKKIVIHCTDSEDSLDIGFREINQWHKERGWLSQSGISCGYHYIIRRNGKIEKGRPLEEAGAHVSGHNSTSIGIVWVGRKNISPGQMGRLLSLTRWLMQEFAVEPDQVFGHYELNPGKTCPNLDMNKVRAELLFSKPEAP